MQRSPEAIVLVDEDAIISVPSVVNLAAAVANVCARLLKRSMARKM